MREAARSRFPTHVLILSLSVELLKCNVAQREHQILIGKPRTVPHARRARRHRGRRRRVVVFIFGVLSALSRRALGTLRALRRRRERRRGGERSEVALRVVRGAQAALAPQRVLDEGAQPAGERREHRAHHQLRRRGELLVHRRRGAHVRAVARRGARGGVERAERGDGGLPLHEERSAHAHELFDDGGICGAAHERNRRRTAHLRLRSCARQMLMSKQKNII